MEIIYRIISVSDERWLPIQEKGINNYYRISDYGNVYSTFSNKILSTHDDKDGYKIITLTGRDLVDNTYMQKDYKLHRLVAYYFIPNPYNKPQVNHKNLDKADNYYGNLEWVTDAENKLHAKESGVIKENCLRGDMRPNAIFTDFNIHYICELMEQGYGNEDIRYQLKLFDENDRINKIYYKILYDIRNRIIWSHITHLYNY